MNQTVKQVKQLSIIMAAVIMVFFSGCASGPHWKSEFTIPKPSKSLKGKAVVVSNFIRSEYGITVTDSARIREIRESAYVYDVSEIIASSLRASGITAEARMDARPASLVANEVLVRGAVGVERVDRPFGRRLLDITLFFPTIGVIGGILPSPMQWNANPVVAYRVEIIDSSGRILMQTGEKEITAQFTCWWIYDCEPPNGDGDLVKKKTAADEAVQKVAAVLAETLRQ